MSSVPSASDRTTAAIWFAGHGFGIFPVWSTRDGQCRCPAGPACTSPGKHPITTDGFKSATTDPDRIRTFLSAKSEPNYGMVPPDGVFIWDVDTDDERARLATLEALHGPLPATLRDDTGNGQHLFLRWPDGPPRPIHKMFGFVTRWGTGAMRGYVVGPLSIHVSGRVYRSAKDSATDIATLPETWARAAVDGGTITFQAGGTGPEAVPVGGRHDWLRNRARFYAGTLRDEHVLFAAVWAENLRLPVPKSEDEVRRAIGDALVKFPPDPVTEDPDTGEVVRDRGEGIGLLSPRDDSSLFPEDPGDVAYAGLLGDCVRDMAAGTDASPVALLASLVAFCGALMPARGYFHGWQTSSPFIALVGHTGDGRKGTAMYRARDALGLSIGMQTVNRVKLDGVASGEGLVKALHERGTNPTGVMFEEEYATFLAASGREGATLDTRMRAAYDGNQLSNRKVGDSMTVADPYWLSALVAITPAELQERVPRGSFKSGSGNRWLWLPVKRRDVIVRSEEPNLPADLAGRLVEAHRLALTPRVLGIGNGVDELLTQYDRFLRANSVGLEADMTRRYTGIAFRIALVHASVETSTAVTTDHVARALALTEYARRGMEWVFGAALGDGSSTLLLRQLQEEGSLSNGIISKYLIRDPLKRQAAVDELCRLGLARVARVPTGGRHRTELRLEARNGGFRDFRALITNRHIQEVPAPERAHEGAEARISAHKGAEEREADAQKVRESGERSDATWLRPCSHYSAHQTSHRRTPQGWICRACDQEETPA